MFSADTLQQALVQDYGRLCTLANKILQDSHLAQDAVQESWLRLNRARPDTTDAEKLRHLLLVTVRHTALNMRRSRRAEPAEDAVFAALPDAGPLPQESWNAARPCAACWRQCRRWKKPTAPSCSCNTGRA